MAPIRCRPATCSRQIAPLDLVQERIATRTPRTDLPATPPDPRFSVLTVLDGPDDLALLPATASGLAALAAAPGVNGRLDWILTGTASAAVTLQSLPAGVLGVTRILAQTADPAGAEPAAAQAAQAARGTFLIPLAPGAVPAADTLDILDHYLRAFPHCRYVSAPAHGSAPTAPMFDSSELFSQDALAGGLAAVRADLFAALGHDPRFAGASAYDRALRAALAEPILLIPEALVAAPATAPSAPAVQRRERALTAVRMAILRQLVDETWPPAPAPPLPRSRVERGLCLVRTQGRRPDLMPLWPGAPSRRGAWCSCTRLTPAAGAATPGMWAWRISRPMPTPISTSASWMTTTSIIHSSVSGSSRRSA
ncbi:MAG: hypothetical protein B7Z15_07950 [Rhizobiales bacterium 32-66-8]|nr:MAG: hypothetical protein B7Z15_07950 [Rhizobiales bacterium 32-66-8]